jgi:glutaconate CoA-transferase subunit B
MTFSIDEWFVVTLARTIGDREVVFHGFGSPCAQVAMHVARRNHAPNMLLVEGATYAVNPEPPFLPPTGNDWSLQQGAAYRMRFEEFFDAAMRGDVDRMFLSGAQIDPYGNTNVTVVGPMDRPRVKLGGGGGGCNLAGTIRNFTLWTTRHRTGRTLVPRCDFVTDMAGTTPGGPQWLVTELGVFDFDSDGHAQLRQLYPDVFLEDVRAATGFSLRIASDLCTVPPPSTSELAALRSADPLGIRKSEFSSEDLGRSFAHGHQTGRASCDGAVHPRPQPGR